MQIKSVQKFVRTSPRKLRLVADIARQLRPSEVVDVLPHTQKRAAEPMMKVVKSALANAKAVGISEDRLYFEEIQINEGPRLKRGRAVSRGRWHPYQRRMSHIRVVLGVREEKKIDKTKEKVEKKSKAKKTILEKSEKSTAKTVKKPSTKTKTNKKGGNK